MLLFSHFAKAQKNNAYERSDSAGFSWDRFTVSAGMFLTGLNDELSLVNQGAGVGLIINLEDALGLKRTTTVFRGELEYNYGKRRRHTLRFEYYGLFRNADKILERELVFGDIVYPIGTELKSEFNFQIFRFLYDYNFYVDERIKLGISSGIYIMPMNLSIQSSVYVDENEKFIAPLPVLGFRSAFRITKKVVFKQNIEVLYLSFAEFKGSIVDSKFSIEYFPWTHLGMGLGYNAFRYNVAAYVEDSPLGSFKGAATSSFTGLMASLMYSF